LNVWRRSNRQPKEHPNDNSTGIAADTAAVGEIFDGRGAAEGDRGELVKLTARLIVEEALEEPNLESELIDE
jgi:hypothetical protein